MSVFRIGNRIVNYGGNLLYGTWTPPPPPKYVYLDDIHTLVPNDSTWYQINDGGIVYSQNHYNSHEGQDPSMYNVSSNVPEYDEYGWTYCEDEYAPLTVIYQDAPIQCEVNNGTIASVHTFTNPSVTEDELLEYPRESMFFIYKKDSTVYEGRYNVRLNIPKIPSKYETVYFQLYEKVGDHDASFFGGVPNVNITVEDLTIKDFYIRVANEYYHAVEGTMPAGEIDLSGLKCSYLNLYVGGTRSSECKYRYNGYKRITLGSLPETVCDYLYTDVLDLSKCQAPYGSLKLATGYVGAFILNGDANLDSLVYWAIYRAESSFRGNYTLGTYEGKPAYIRNGFPI